MEDDSSVLNKSLQKVANSSSPSSKNDKLDDLLSTKSHTSLFGVATHASIGSNNTNGISGGNTSSIGSFIVPQIP